MALGTVKNVVGGPSSSPGILSSFLIPRFQPVSGVLSIICIAFFPDVCFWKCNDYKKNNPALQKSENLFKASSIFLFLQSLSPSLALVRRHMLRESGPLTFL